MHKSAENKNKIRSGNQKGSLSYLNSG